MEINLKAFESNSTHNRIIDGKMTLDKLMIYSLQFSEFVFYIISNNTFVGVIDKQHLLNLPEDNLTSNPKLSDIAKKHSSHYIIYNDSSNIIQEILNHFRENKNITEVAIIDKESKLIAVVDKSKYFSLVASFTHNLTEPTLMWGFTKKYQEPYKGIGKYAHNINSQHGEDGIINKIFEVIGFKSRFAVEFGAWDGVYLSNIRNLITNHNFSAVFIEGDSDKCIDLKNNYQNYSWVKCVEAFVGFEENTLDEILEANNAPNEIDLISIDIDGYDYYILDSLEKFLPRVIVIEYNPTISNDVFFIPPKNSNVFQGTSASALLYLANRKGYELAAVTQTNLILVQQAEFSKLNILDNSLDNLRKEDFLSNGRYFQAYDKTMYRIGFDSYVWTGEPINSKKFKSC